MFKKSVVFTIFLYSALIIFLGYYGYLKSGSYPSLISSISFGSLLVLSGFLILQERIEGVYGSLISTLLLTAVFAYRYTVTSRVIPAVLCVVSGLMLLFLFARFVRRPVKKQDGAGPNP